MIRFFRWIGRIIEHLSRLEAMVAAIFSVGLVLFITYGMLSRYFFHFPVFGSIEIPSFVFLVTTALSVAYVLMLGGHVRVDIITMRLPSKIKGVLNIIALFLTLLVFSFLLWASLFKMFSYIREKIFSTDIHFPLFAIALFLPLGLFVACLQAIVEISKAVTELKKAKPIGGRNNS